MKILFFTGDLKATGGIQEYNRNFLRAVREIKKDDIFTIELKSGVLGGKFRFVFSFFKFLFLFKPDLVICGHINFSPLGYFANKIFGVKYAIFTHGIEVWNIKKNFYAKTLKTAAMITAVSSYTKKRIIEQIPEVEKKIFILFNSIDGERFKIKEKSLDLSRKYGLENKKVILTVARLSAGEKYKGYDKVILSLPEIILKIPNVAYLLVGSGDDELRIKKMVGDLKLENYVIFTGVVEAKELIDYYNIADVFVMPSKGEGFGIVFLEALACGKPVIAGNSDGSRDAVLDGELGLLVNPDNVDEIAKTIIDILDRNAPSRLLDGDYLRKKVLEVYRFDKFKEKVKNLMYELQR